MKMVWEISVFLVALLLSEILHQFLLLILFVTALGDQRAKTSWKKKSKINRKFIWFSLRFIAFPSFLPISEINGWEPELKENQTSFVLEKLRGKLLAKGRRREGAQKNLESSELGLNPGVCVWKWINARHFSQGAGKKGITSRNKIQETRTEGSNAEKIPRETAGNKLNISEMWGY